MQVGNESTKSTRVNRGTRENVELGLREKTRESKSRCSIFRVFADLLLRSSMETNGGVAQLGEHLLCKQGVHGFEPRHLHQRETAKRQRGLKAREKEQKTDRV